MTNHIENVFLKILQGNIKYDDKDVPVVIRDFPIDKTPCVTITSEEGIMLNRTIGTAEYKLPTTHPLYDPNDPEKKYPQEVVSDKKTGRAVINIWMNDKNQRKKITENVQLILFKATYYNYQFCINFDKETKKCNTTNNQCDVFTVFNRRGIKEQCPYPKLRRHANIFSAKGIPESTVKVRTPVKVDELDKKPPLLRDSIRVDLIFYDTYITGGNPIKSVGVDFGTEIK